MQTSLHRRLGTSAALLLVSLALVACNKGSAKPDSQVAVKVNDEEISVHQVEALLGRQPPAPAGQGDAQVARVVEVLVEQELAAQAARQAGLDRDPRIVQLLEVARRDVLARAYQDSLADRAVQPGTDEIDRYYDSQPALFAQRRVYTVQEIGVIANAQQVAALDSMLARTPGGAAARELVRAAGLQHESRQLTLRAEEVPLPVLTSLAALREGQSLVLPRDRGARVITVLSAEAAPVDRKTAEPAIQQHLLLARKREQVQQGMKSLRGAAKLEYKGRFAPPAAAASAPPLAPAASAS